MKLPVEFLMTISNHLDNVRDLVKLSLIYKYWQSFVDLSERTRSLCRCLPDPLTLEGQWPADRFSKADLFDTRCTLANKDSCTPSETLGDSF